ncbi:lipopolysaccharide assembly protein LapB [Endozoicomonas sp. SESOKO2]|uniref:tetratricopeptide repeat protein n=3 Tax=unclassified Endozoicomonas TaxID=2644528 RepID=UPI0021496EC9|nr:hypothetical protein [Endozoicomonas sp. SESOKO2]
MSYGLPPAYGSTSQPSQHRLPESDQDAHQDRKPASDLNPNALPFVPRRSWENRFSNGQDIHRRQTTAHGVPSSRGLQPSRKKQSPIAAEENISQAYEALKNQCFTDAEETFRSTLEEYRGQLNQADERNATIGLARSLKEQTPEKQKEACSLLQKLRSEEPLTELGASRIPNLDLTLSRCEIALGLIPDAETRLLKLRNINPDADEEILCQKSHNFDADVTNARLWQFMKKHQMTETLLVNMKTELTEMLQSHRYRGVAERLRKQLHTVNIALVRLLQERDLYEWAEDLLLKMSGKRSNNSEALLCKACGDDEIDLALARLWQLMGKNEQAEKLLLSMSGKHPNASEEILCRPYWNLDIDMTLVRHWEVMDRYHLAEKLLLNMVGKHLGLNEAILCQPCGNDELDLILARLWYEIKKYEWAERLLLNMSHKHPNDNEERLCKSCGNKDIDLALIRVWEMLGKYKWAEKLLLNVAGKSPLASEEELCKPCGDFIIDHTMTRYWERVGENKRAEKLLLNMSGKSPKATEEILCQPCGHFLIDLALVRVWEAMGDYKQCEKLLLNIIGKQPDDNEEDLCRPSGNHDVDLALARLWQMMNKNKRAQRLIQRCCDLYQTSECQLALLSLHAGTAKFMKMMTGCQESANTLLLTSIHYFRLATRLIAEGDPGSGQDNLKKALEHVESALEKNPLSASACSQKAHCLRMMRYSEDVWSEWFKKAKTLDPGRVEKFRADDAWRITEAIALQKVQNLARRT